MTTQKPIGDFQPGPGSEKTGAKAGAKAGAWGISRLAGLARAKLSAAATATLAALFLLTIGVAGGLTGPALASMGSLPALSHAAPAAIQMVADQGDKQNVPLLRQQYVEEVQMLAGKAETMRLAGSSQEEIARTLHADRRALGVKYKNLTEPSLLATIYARNEKKYGDKLGPTVEWLRANGKSWEDIIASSSRTGGADVNFNAKPAAAAPSPAPTKP